MKPHYENIEEIKEEWRGSLVASFMAKRFNKDMFSINDKGDLMMSFNDVFILKSKKMENRYLAVEKVLKGPFTKYNNNWGYVADYSKFKEKSEEHIRFNDVAQAFSHYSYEKSDGYILVCDLQGVVQRLTDPMILNKNFSKLQGDLSGPGIVKFFSSHKCNEICKKLGLGKMMEEEISDDVREAMEEIETACGAKNTSLSTLDNGEEDEEVKPAEYKDEGLSNRFSKNKKK